MTGPTLNDQPKALDLANDAAKLVARVADENARLLAAHEAHVARFPADETEAAHDD